MASLLWQLKPLTRTQETKKETTPQRARFVAVERLLGLHGHLLVRWHLLKPFFGEFGAEDFSEKPSFL